MNNLSPQPGAATSEPMLQVDQLDIHLSGRPILADVHLRLHSGELVALLGPNGAGKSTLVRTLAGELHAPDNSLHFASKPLNRWGRSAIARHRAVMPQKVDLQFPMTVEEVIALGRPREKPEQRGRVIDALLERLDIVHLKNRLVPTLSGGEQQRAQLARVLAQVWDQPDPRLLLLDECTSALDPAHQQVVFGLMKQMASAGYGLLVAVHDLNLAAQYADRLVLMKEGRIVAEGAPADVLTSTNLKKVYGLSARVTMLPEGYPLVIPMPHGTPETGD